MEGLEIIDLKDIDQVEVIMNQLSQIQKDNNDTVKSVFDDNLSIQKVVVLNGGYGWKIDIQATYYRNFKKTQKVKKSMNLMSSDLANQQEITYELLNNKNLIIDQGNSFEVKQYIESLQTKIQQLMEKHKILYE